MYADELGDIRSRGGIWSERPRSGKPGRLGVVGEAPIALSSFDFRFSGSLNLGDGIKAGGPLSDNERALDGDLDVGLHSNSFSFSVPLSSTFSIFAMMFSLN